MPVLAQYVSGILALRLSKPREAIRLTAVVVQETNVVRHQPLRRIISTKKRIYLIIMIGEAMSCICRGLA